MALAAAGWGIFWVASYRFVTIATDAAGWRELCPPWAKPRLFLLLILRWIGEAVNTLIPVAQVGGGIVRARLLGLSVGPSGENVQPDFISAGAATAVDFTLGVLAQAVCTLLGIAFLLHAASGPLSGLYRALLAVATFIIGTLFVLYMAQRRGLFQKLALGFEKTLAGTFSFAGLQFQERALALDRAVSDLYANRAAIARCTAWRILAGILRTGETWLAMYFLRAPVSWTDALILESLGTAVRSAVFLVPAGLGAQEGGFVLIGSLLGIAPPLCLALSLVKRAREIIVGVPGLITWALLEKRSSQATSKTI